MFAKKYLTSPLAGGQLFPFPLLFLSLLCMPCFSSADSLEDAARALARKVASLPLKSAPISTAWNNYSAMSNSQFESFRAAFLDELKSRNRNLSQVPSAARLSVYASETPTRLLFIAVVPTADGDQVCVAELQREALPLMGKPGGNPRLQKELIWRQREPILGAAERSSSPNKPNLLLILNRDSLALLRFEKDQWVLQDSRLLAGTGAPSRDLRGQIEFPEDRSDRAKVLLRGTVCDVELRDTLNLACRTGAEPFRDAVFLASPCDRPLWWLMSDSGDWTVPDHLLLRNPSLEKTAPAVSEMQMAGPVLSISAGQALQAAHAVVFNLATGNYEVYRITLACGD